MRYTRALCRKIPKSIVSNGLRMEEPDNPVNYELAIKQHEHYIQALKDAGITSVTILESDESLPDCVFVEDTCIVIGNTALITNPGAESRRAEVKAIRDHFNSEPGMKVISMQSPAHVDGGDVLFTGKEIFVGISKRSNVEGARVLQDVFPEFPVHSIRVGDGTLHLKSLMSMAGDDLILFGESSNAVLAKELVLSSATVAYKVMTVPDDYAANCLYINGVLIHRSVEEYPASVKLLTSCADRTIGLIASELAKVDGALTCCSLLY